MKNVYTTFYSALFILAALFSQSLSAQTLCPGSNAANKITYVYTLATTTASSSTITFPKFDPSKGTLLAVTLEDTISGITATTVMNSGSVSTTYQFVLTVANDISGTGIDQQTTYTKNYGPNTLAQGASIQYGPDSLFTNVADSSTTTNTASYIGTTGTVSFVYSLSGGLTALSGGLNYNGQINTTYHGVFRLIYYWCAANSQNNNNCINLNAVKDASGTCVHVKWNSNCEHTGCTYEIGCGRDGQNFTPCGQQHADSPSANTNGTGYEYKYPCSQSERATLHFRIKCTDSLGNVTYSPVRTVCLNPGGLAYCQVYPNPVKDAVNVQFDENMTGNFVADILNGSGQCVQRCPLVLNGTNQAKISLSGNHKPGLYYLWIRDNAHNQQFTSKIFIQ